VIAVTPQLMLHRVLYRAFVGALVACVAIGLASCGVTKKLTTTVDADRVEVRAATDANDNSPIAVDILLVYDVDLLAKVAELPAVDWFAMRDQLKRDFPQGMDVWEYEIVPGTSVVHELTVVDRYRAYGGIVFCDYPGPGDYRLRFDKLKRVYIRLLADHFEVDPGYPPSNS